MSVYARLCGWTLAKAHARSGDAIAIAAYLGTSDTFDKAMAVFAEKYADQNERDYAALQEAVESPVGQASMRRAEPGPARSLADEADRRPARSCPGASVVRERHRLDQQPDDDRDDGREDRGDPDARDPVGAHHVVEQPAATKAATRPMARLGIQPRMSRPPAMIPEMTPASRPTTIQPTNVKSIGGVWQRPMAPARPSRRNRCASATRLAGQVALPEGGRR